MCISLCFSLWLLKVALSIKGASPALSKTLESMETLPRVLSLLSFEMNCYEFVWDILELLTLKELSEISLLLLLDSDYSETEDINFLLLSKLRNVENEEELIMKVHRMFEVVISAPETVLRPYHQHFVTE